LAEEEEEEEEELGHSRRGNRTPPPNHLAESVHQLLCTEMWKLLCK